MERLNRLADDIQQEPQQARQGLRHLLEGRLVSRPRRTGLRAMVSTSFWNQRGAASAGLLAVPIIVRAQKTTRIARIGMLGLGSSTPDGLRHHDNRASLSFGIASELIQCLSRQ